jgi:mRNA interferase RelE/StbE
VRLVGFAFTTAALDFLGTVPHKIRRQIIKKAKALHTTSFPPGVKKLHGVLTDQGEAIYRERSGDYRILYVVRSSPAEILILDIDNRKDVYKMPKTKSESSDELRMSESEFDAVMGNALGVPPPPDKAAKGKPGNEPRPTKPQR